MSDLVERLRDRERLCLEGVRPLVQACEAAANEITRLRADLAEQPTKDELWTAIRGRDEKINKLVKTLAALEMDNADFASKAVNLRAALAEAESDRECLKDSNRKLREEFDKTIARLAEAERERDELRTDALTASNERLRSACQDWRDKLVRAEADLAAARERLVEAERERDGLRDAHGEASRMFRILNGMDIDDWDRRAEHLMQTMLDGLHIGETNRLTVKGVIAEHFADIGARAERAEADLAAAREVIAALMPPRLEWKEMGDGLTTVNHTKADLRRARAFLDRTAPASPQNAK